MRICLLRDCNCKLLVSFVSTFIIFSFGFSQTTLPFQIVNNSTDFTDDQIYIGLVGQTTDSGAVWIDFKANGFNSPALNKISESWNTVNKSPGDWGYAPMFTKLSEIKNKTLYIPNIFGCRIYVSFKNTLYMHFFASGGYTGPNLQNPTDPNNGIRWEIVELTWASNGLWTNTSRVDAYQYPMGLEIWGKSGANNLYGKTGELLTHRSIIQNFQSTFSTGDFLPCYTNQSFSNDPIGGIILQPSKLDQFNTGVSKNYFQDYIDRIWNYYTTNELVVTLGDRGEYRGKVVNDTLKMVGPGGIQAWIAGKPNTQEILEGNGKLAQDVLETPDSAADLALQAQFCAAANRGVIDLNIPGGQSQDWGNTSKFFVTDIFNQYVWFFHQPKISFNSKTYAFAYDDVYNQSSTLQTSIPDSVKITVGGFANAIWIGVVSADWTNGSNWSCGAVPDSANDVIIPQHTPFSPVIPNGIIVSCRSISVMTGAVVTVGTNSNLNILN